MMLVCCLLRQSLKWPSRPQWLAVLLIAILSQGASAQVMNVKQLNAEKTRWTKMAADQKQVQFVGRFRGAGGTLQLEKFEVPCRLPSTIQLPERIADGEAMEITGKFVLDNGKLSFLISRIVYRGLVPAELNQQAASIPSDKADVLLKLADQYVEQADYYNDQKLHEEIAAVRKIAVEAKRKQARGNSASLRNVQAMASTLNVDPQFVKNLKFEILFTDSQVPGVDVDALLTEIRTLDAWDRQVPPVPDTLKSRFDKEAPAIYDSGTSTERELLHRQLYSTIRLQQIRRMLKDDGSNGLLLADTVRSEFTDQGDLCKMFEQREVDYQLGKVNQLSRQQLQQLTTLLGRLRKDDLIDGVLQKWLAAQEGQFGTDSLAGLLRTADEYLFVGDTWKRAQLHAQGVELLKRSWATATTQSPEDARLIADRLSALGWEHLGGRWLTKQQMQTLPKDDLQLALREERVVKGMSDSQVTRFLGKPNRIARIGGARSLTELWIYDAEGSAGMVVRFQKSTSSGGGKSEKIVEDVSRISGPGR